MKPEISKSSWLRPCLTLVALAFAIATFTVLHRHAVGMSWPDLRAGIEHVPHARVCMALLLTAVSFAMLGAYEVLACDVVAPSQIPLAAAVLAGVCGNAVSNTLGFHAVTGTAIRVRIYQSIGVGLGTAARVTSLSWFGIALGIVGMLAISELVGSLAAEFIPSKMFIGLGLATALALLALGLPRHGRALRWGKFSISVPSRQLAIWLMALGVVENGAAIAAMYVLLPADSAPTFTLFALSYVSAVMLGIVSHIPGGLGVFEATMLGVWGTSIGSQLLPVLVLYRFIYNLLPFALSTFALAVWELRTLRHARALG